MGSCGRRAAGEPVKCPLMFPALDLVVANRLGPLPYAAFGGVAGAGSPAAAITAGPRRT